MKQPERTIASVKTEIEFAKRNNKPRVLAKLHKELEDMQWNATPTIPAQAKPAREFTQDEMAAMGFYSDKRFKLD